MPVPDPKQTALSADGLGDCAASVADELAAVRRCMAEQLTASDRAVDEMLAYVAARTGKMLRPAMMLLVARSCGNLNETHIRAAVVELIHAATSCTMTSSTKPAPPQRRRQRLWATPPPSFSAISSSARSSSSTLPPRPTASWHRPQSPSAAENSGRTSNAATGAHRSLLRNRPREDRIALRRCLPPRLAHRRRPEARHGRFAGRP